MLVLTDRAIAMKKELLALANNMEQQMTQNLSDEEQEQLAGLLLKML